MVDLTKICSSEGVCIPNSIAQQADPFKKHNPSAECLVKILSQLVLWNSIGAANFPSRLMTRH